jgi:DivIVA domain-containing protein
MGQLLILLAVALVAAALAWGVAVLLLGRDPGLEPAEPDGRAIPLPTARPLTESDIGLLRFDTGARGYRMAQVDQALRRAAYDIGYKEELIGVLEAEVAALREGRTEDAETLRRAREAAQRPRTGRPVDPPEPDDARDTDDALDSDMLDSDMLGADVLDSHAPSQPDSAGSARPDSAGGAGSDPAAPAGDALTGPDGTAVNDWVASGARGGGARGSGGPGAEPADGEK